MRREHPEQTRELNLWCPAAEQGGDMMELVPESTQEGCQLPAQISWQCCPTSGSHHYVVQDLCNGKAASLL